MGQKQEKKQGNRKAPCISYKRLHIILSSSTIFLASLTFSLSFPPQICGGNLFHEFTVHVVSEETLHRIQLCDFIKSSE